MQPIIMPAWESTRNIHGKYIQLVNDLYSRIKHSYEYEQCGRSNRIGRAGNSKYEVVINGDLCALKHYDVVVAIINIKTRDLLKFSGSTRSDADGINTLLLIAGIITYKGEDIGDLYVSCSKSGVLTIKSITTGGG